MFGAIFSNNWMTALVQKLVAVAYEDLDHIEATGATYVDFRFTPTTLVANLNKGAFDITNWLVNGKVITQKSGFYSFNAKTQITVLGVCGIGKDTNASNGQSTQILQSVVPVTGQEFGMNWTGYIPAFTEISFNTSTSSMVSNQSHLFCMSYLGTKAPL